MLDFPASPTMGQAYGQWLWDGVKWGQGNVTASTWPFNDTGRNLLHNGRFEVAQRGAGPWTTNNSYTADRWFVQTASDTFSFSLVALSDADRAAIGDEAATTSLQNVFTGSAVATAQHYVDQHIEGVRRLGGKTVTISFWARCAAGALKVGINMMQNFGSGGSPSAVVIVLPTGNSTTLSTTWARYTSTIALPSVAGKTLGTNNDDSTFLRLYYSSGANTNANAGNIGVQSGTIQLWGIQLEISSVATPLAKLDAQQDQALCERFYQTSTAYMSTYLNASAVFGAAFALRTRMRAVPTIAFPGSAYTNASGATAALVGQGFVVVTATATAAGIATFNAPFTASADL